MNEGNELNASGLCMCGCGRPAPIATRTRGWCGHVRGKPIKYIPEHRNRRQYTPEELPNPSGLCKCGCGQQTALAKSTQRGLVKGQSVRYLPGHHAKGADNPNWTGGGPYFDRGYVVVKLAPDHPFFVMADEHGRVFEHRLAVAEQLGRPLSSAEQVHHLDGVRANNSPENLLLVSSWGAHMRVEQLQKKLAADWDEITGRLFPGGTASPELVSRVGAGPVGPIS